MIAPDWFAAALALATFSAVAGMFCIICIKRPDNPQDHETDHHHDQEDDA